MYFVGIDGGGTKTRASAYRGGAMISSFSAGPMNYNFIPESEALENLISAVRGLRIPISEIAAVGIGDPSIDDSLSGSGEGASRFYDSLRRELSCPVYVRSDAYMSLIGLTGGDGPGVSVISGTGAMAIACRESGEVRVAGGWGRLTGDEGGGYYIALGGIKVALMAADGISPKTALTGALMSYFGVSEPRKLIYVFYGAEPPEIAGFSAEVAACAESGDAAAKEILKKAARYLSSYAVTLAQWCGSGRIGIYGSVLRKNMIVREEFESLVRQRLGKAEIILPTVPPEEAAARYASRMLDEDAKRNRGVDITASS